MPSGQYPPSQAGKKTCCQIKAAIRVLGVSPNEMRFAVHFQEVKMSDKMRISPIYCGTEKVPQFKACAVQNAVQKKHPDKEKIESKSCSL